MPIFVIALISASLVFLRGNILDPDLGWRLRLGKYMVENHALVHNFVGYNVFASIRVIDHQWLSDILIYFVYNKFGYISLIFITFVVVFLTLYTLWRICFEQKTSIAASIISIILFLLSFAMLFGGFRLQYIIFLCAALIMLIYRKVKDFRVRLILYFLLFMFGSNMHGGGFLVLLPVTVLFEAGQFFAKPKSFSDFFRRVGRPAVVLVSLIVALSINPYGIEFWKLMWLYVVDNYSRTHINEWFPIYSLPLVWYVILVILPLTLWLFTINQYWKKIKLNELVLLILLFLGGIQARRAFPLFMLVATPFLAAAVDDFFGMARAKSIVKWVFVALLGLIFIGALIKNSNPLISLHPDVFANKNDIYPTGAMAFISEHKMEGVFLNPYSWGGFIAWNNPDLKIFVDGRAPMLAVEDKKSLIQLSGEIYTNCDTLASENTLNKYRIGYILIDKNEYSHKSSLDKFALKYFSLNKQDENSTKKLSTCLATNREWGNVYEDDLSIVYKRQNCR